MPLLLNHMKRSLQNLNIALVAQLQSRDLDAEVLLPTSAIKALLTIKSNQIKRTGTGSTKVIRAHQAVIPPGLQKMSDYQIVT